MDRKTTGIAIILFGLVAIFAIIWFMFFRTTEVSPVAPETPVAQTPKASVPLTNLPLVAPEKDEKEVIVTPRETGEIELARMAGSFAERFGSYSNQSNFGNITDLKLFMTSDMKKWADDYVMDARARTEISLAYYGITTKAVTEEVIFFDNDTGHAEVLVETSRREAIGTTNNASNFYQDIKIVLIKVKGVWKVDRAYWQEKK